MGSLRPIIITAVICGSLLFILGQLAAHYGWFFVL